MTHPWDRHRLPPGPRINTDRIKRDAEIYRLTLKLPGKVVAAKLGITPSQVCNATFRHRKANGIAPKHGGGPEQVKPQTASEPLAIDHSDNAPKCRCGLRLSTPEELLQRHCSDCVPSSYHYATARRAWP